MKVLLTGGTGFLGAHVVAALIESGHSAIVYDDLSASGADAVARTLMWRFDRTGRLAFVFRALDDAGELARAARGCGAIVHLPAPDGGARPGTFAREALAHAATLLDVARTTVPDAQIVIGSSAEVYGQAPIVDGKVTVAADERFKPRPETLEASMLAATEAAALGWGKSFDQPVTVMRLASLYGGADVAHDDAGFVARMLAAGESGAPLAAPVPLPFPVDLLHVVDAASAFLHVLERPRACADEIFNVGGGVGEAPSLRRVERHLRTLGRGVQLLDPDVTSRPPFVLDTGKLTAVTGWRPRISWREGLARLAAAPSRRERARDDREGASTADRPAGGIGTGLIAWPRAEGLA